MKKILLIFSFILWSSFLTSSSQSVHIIQIKDSIINPIIDEYIETSIRRAEKERVECLIIEMDTPGGLLNSTRHIVKHMLNSTVPIVIYVSPSGSRAASAGVFITLASHIAAMTPGTNMGAAHPVNLGGGGFWKKPKEKMEDMFHPSENDDPLTEIKKVEDTTKNSNEEKNYDPMVDKVMNDTLAWVRSICSSRGRDSAWPTLAVTNSVSITAEEAYEKKVIDVLATDMDDLIQQIDQRKVKIANQEKMLDVKNAQRIYYPLTMRQNILNTIAHPNIAYILMIIGFYGLLFELTHPGIGFPGIGGVISLVLAFYSFQALPVDYAGVILITLAFILFIAEIYSPGVGLLAFGGIVCLSLGSLMLMDTDVSYLKISYSVMIPTILISMGLFGFLIFMIAKVRWESPISGLEGMIGQLAQVHSDINPDQPGKISINGEIWNAVSEQIILKGNQVLIIKADGLTLTVEKKEKES